MPKHKKDKIIETDELTRIIARGFEKTTQDIGALSVQVDKRIGDLEKRMDSEFQEIKHDFTPFKKEKMLKFEAEIVDLSLRVADIEKKVHIGKE
jgi:polyhydroxyalkanoate synthesis regulator phasin